MTSLHDITVILKCTKVILYDMFPTFFTECSHRFPEIFGRSALMEESEPSERPEIDLSPEDVVPLPEIHEDMVIS